MVGGVILWVPGVTHVVNDARPVGTSPVGVWPSPAIGLFLVIEEAEVGRIKVAASEHFGGGRKVEV